MARWTLMLAVLTACATQAERRTCLGREVCWVGELDSHHARTLDEDLDAIGWSSGSTTLGTTVAQCVAADGVRYAAVGRIISGVVGTHPDGWTRYFDADTRAQVGWSETHSADDTCEHRTTWVYEGEPICGCEERWEGVEPGTAL